MATTLVTETYISPEVDASVETASSSTLKHPGPSLQSSRISVIEPLEVSDYDAAPNAETGDSTALEPQYPTGAKFWFICLALSCVLLLGGLDVGILATAVPAITDHFHTVADVGWYYSAYRLCSCAFQFLFGKLYKMFSMKRVLLFSVVVFLLGSLVCATASSSKAFIVGRAVSGLGSAGIMAGCWNLLVQILPLHKRSLFTAIFVGIETISVVAAPILGGVLTEELSWRWCFWISLPVGGVALLVIVVFLSDPRQAGGEKMTWWELLRQLDLVGNLVFIPSMTCLFVALSWAGTKYAWNAPVIIGLFVAFGVLLVVFVVDQYVKQDLATVPPRIIKNRNVIAGFIMASCLNGAVGILEYYLPTYFQAIRGYSPAQSGYLMLPIIIGYTLGYIVNASGTSITGFYTPFAILCSILSPVASGLLTTWKVNTTFAQIVLYSGFAGLAMGIGGMASQQAVQTTLAPSDAPLGMAVVLFGSSLGPSLSVSIAQTVLTSRLAANLRDIAPDLDVASIENMGLTQLRTSLGAGNLERVLVGFDKSLSQTWYLAVGLTCATIIGSLTMEWRSIKQKIN